MRDYWLTQELLKLTGWGYVAICGVALILAVRLPKSGWGKAIATAVVIGLASILPYEAKQEIDQQQVNADEFKVRYAKAKALFDERCKTAGEKIYRTVEGVDAVFLVNLKKKRSDGWEYDKNYPSDLYSPDDGNDGAVGIESTQGLPAPDAYVLSYLKARNLDGAPVEKLIRTGFYNAVYTAISSDVNSRIFEYSHQIINVKKRINPTYGDWVFVSELKREEVSHTKKPLYGVEWSDISTSKDRNSWVAGGRTRIINLETKEVIAERSGYLFDSGLGSTSGQRSPWGWAQSYGPRCPDNNESSAKFVFKVLKTK